MCQNVLYLTDMATHHTQLLANSFDLLMNDGKLDALLENISEKEREFLYNHPILKHYDLLP